MSSFPTLFGDSKLGKFKKWTISVEDRAGTGVVITSHGYEGGKFQVNERLVESGKNLGKKNATTPVTQATSEAQALWNKKKDAGYSESASATTDLTTVPLPMLAQDFTKRHRHVVFPCFAQRKLDGVRCVAIAGRGLFSRNGKPSSRHLTHIMLDINRLPVGTVLDGELYSDDLTFQEIVGLVKKDTLREGDVAKMATIYLCVYDTIREGTNAERNTWLSELFDTTFTALRLLPTAECASLDDVKTLHASYVAEGYEGLILRNKSGLYQVGFRSSDLQKYKEFADSEYPVVGFKEGDGLEKGCVIWMCRTTDGKEFAVRPRGTREDRGAAFLTGATMIGRPLTVRYQELTTDGIPRFPVGIAFRTYE